MKCYSYLRQGPVIGWDQSCSLDTSRSAWFNKNMEIWTEYKYGFATFSFSCLFLNKKWKLQKTIKNRGRRFFLTKTILALYFDQICSIISCFAVIIHMGYEFLCDKSGNWQLLYKISYYPLTCILSTMLTWELISFILEFKIPFSTC